MNEGKSRAWCENPLCEREHFEGDGPCHSELGEGTMVHEPEDCKDPMCPTYRAGVRHISDESHREVLVALYRLEQELGGDPRKPEMGTTQRPRPPRDLFLRAELAKQSRVYEMAETAKRLGLALMGVGLAVTVISLLMLAVD